MIDETLPGCRPDCRNFIAFPNEMNIDNFKKEFMCVLK